MIPTSGSGTSSSRSPSAASALTSARMAPRYPGRGGPGRAYARAAAMLLATTSIVWRYFTVGLNSTTSVSAVTTGSVAFWVAESSVLRELYGVVASARPRNLVDRRDRRSELERLVENLARSGRLAAGVSRRDALVTLLLLTSFETYLRASRGRSLGPADGLLPEGTGRASCYAPAG